MRLTIAIPTYNRNELLVENIKRLVAQVTEEVCIIIIDNHSDVEAEKSLAETNLLKEIKNIKIIRNSVNIGGNANILRCFELANTDWLWILSDDDPVLDGAIAAILRNTENKNVIAINFTTLGTSCFERPDVAITTGLEEFLKAIDDFGNFVFLSSNVYNRQEMIKHIGVGYQFAYSGAPHVVMLARALQNNPSANVIFERNSIVEWCNPSIGGTYFMTMGAPTILELPELRPHRAKVLRCLRPYIPWKGAIHQITLSWRLGLGSPYIEIRSLRRRIWEVLSIYGRIQIFLIQNLFLIPILGASAVEFIYLLKNGKKTSVNNFGGL